MEKTIIRFKQKPLYFNFAMGGLMMACGILSWIYGNNQLLGLLGIGLLWTGLGFYKQISGYVTVGHDFIQVHESPFSRKIAFSEIREIKYFAGDWIIKYGNDKEVYINTNWVAPQSLPILQAAVESIQSQSRLINS